jgi:peptidoglycan/xylan/chitin deacetylase (PgdA/CDA1 family)
MKPLLAFSLGALLGCAENPLRVDLALDQAPFHFALLEEGRPVLQVEALKWHDGHRAAVSINYDAAWGTHPDHRLATDEVIARGLRLDLEMVTAVFQQPRHFPLIERMHQELIPRGVHFFGHGHRHINHDSLGYEEALADFKLNFDLMRQWGLRPRAYAYPGSTGYNTTTQLANQQAGFLCARGSAADPSQSSICPNDTTEPANWYYLPSAVMSQGESANYVNTHAELVPILADALERRAWVILMYHAIGIPEGWGYYPLEDFRQDLDAIAGADFWSANMDMAAAYIKERNALALDLRSAKKKKGWRHYDLVFRDGLDNEVYDQPLTLEFRFAPELSIDRLQIDPPLEGGADFAVTGDQLRLHVLPDEQVYSLRIR